VNVGMLSEGSEHVVEMVGRRLEGQRWVLILFKYAFKMSNNNILLLPHSN